MVFPGGENGISHYDLAIQILETDSFYSIHILSEIAKICSALKVDSR